jgi:phage gp16-like protein
MNYSFNTQHAVQYGLDEAVMLHNLLFWLAKNKANGSNIHDGKVWTYNSASAFTQLFPFWKERKIARILVSLEEQGAIESGCYNKAGYDRKKWYSSPLLEPFVKTDLSISQNCPMHLSEMTDALVNNDRPIADINADGNPNSKPKRSLTVKSENQLRIEKLFGKRVSTPWDRAEQRSWVTAKGIVDDMTDREWTDLEVFYAAPQEKTYARKTLSTLLNNLSGELDKAANWSHQHTRTQVKQSTEILNPIESF